MSTRIRYPAEFSTHPTSNYFASSSVVLHAFSALCVYSKFGHHPHPPGYLCAKFSIFHCLHCWASPWRKIAYSITQSIINPAYLMPQEPKFALRNMVNHNHKVRNPQKLYFYCWDKKKSLVIDSKVFAIFCTLEERACNSTWRICQSDKNGAD